jgi:pyruvate/2-oxoglutarate dehydrogenase complex dihydrolipoamide dehydrogenase (E3) component
MGDLTEAQARHEYGGALTVLRQDFHHNDRAVTEGIAKGLLKVMVVRGRPVGASIAGPQAGELIALWTLAISAKLKISAIAGMILPYPTLGEVSKRAAGAYFAPKLFDNPQLKRFVRFVQRVLP